MKNEHIHTALRNVLTSHGLVVVNSVPRYLLEDMGRGEADPFRISDYTHGKMKKKMNIE